MLTGRRATPYGGRSGSRRIWLLELCDQSASDPLEGDPRRPPPGEGTRWAPPCSSSSASSVAAIAVDGAALIRLRISRSAGSSASAIQSSTSGSDPALGQRVVGDDGVALDVLRAPGASRRRCPSCPCRRSSARPRRPPPLPRSRRPPPRRSRRRSRACRRTALPSQQPHPAPRARARRRVPPPRGRAPRRGRRARPRSRQGPADRAERSPAKRRSTIVLTPCSTQLGPAGAWSGAGRCRSGRRGPDASSLRPAAAARRDRVR